MCVCSCVYVGERAQGLTYMCNKREEKDQREH